jgi:hypothetical protein
VITLPLPTNIANASSIHGIQGYDREGHPIELRDGYNYSVFSATSTTTISVIPLYIGRIVISSSGSTSNVADFYDGTTTNDTLMFSYTGLTTPASFVIDCLSTVGLTVDITVNTAPFIVLVTYRPFVAT